MNARGTKERNIETLETQETLAALHDEDTEDHKADFLRMQDKNCQTINLLK